MLIINRIIDRFEKIAVEISSLALIVIMLLTTVDVLIRKTVDYAIPSLYEFTEDYLMVVLVFFSLGYVYNIGGHVRVTFVSRMIPGSIMKWVNSVLRILYLLFFAVMLVQGVLTAYEKFQFQEVSSSILAYPLGPAYAVVPIGAFLAFVRIGQHILRTSSET